MDENLSDEDRESYIRLKKIHTRINMRDWVKSSLMTTAYNATVPKIIEYLKEKFTVDDEYTKLMNNTNDISNYDYIENVEEKVVNKKKTN
jgi:hypothetical protein